HESLLAERFVPGPELAVEGLLDHGRLELLALFDKPDPLDGPAFEETIYVTPSRLSDGEQRAALAAVQAATRALGLGQGPVHAEVRLSGGRAFVIELAARTIGGLCGRALAFGTGHSLEELVLAQALGVALEDRRRDAQASGVLMIPIPHPGVLRAVEGRQAAMAVPGVTAIEVTIAPGRPLSPPPEGGRYLGFVFARARRPQDVEKALRTAGALLDVQIDPGPTTTPNTVTACAGGSEP
ncbi:MAG TPA: ATP-grasp domain-containing protein, partial [Acidimicrobiales bacterium]|nr:ATP-grasp domain-containing protein [Acidimicrobiales bacterium]